MTLATRCCATTSTRSCGRPSSTFPVFSETAPVLPATPPVGTSLLEILDAHFVTENPVVNRRKARYQISQNQGQTSSLVVSKIREDALLADINNLTFDESCTYRGNFQG